MLSGAFTEPSDGSAVGLHHGCGVALKGRAESVVGGDEEPAISAALHDGAAGSVGQFPSVVGPVDGIRRAFCAGQIRSRRARVDEDLVLFLGEFADRQRHARVRHIHDNIDALLVEPFAPGVDGDVGLVLVVGRNDFDLQAFTSRFEILDRQSGGDGGPFPAHILVKARLVVQDADLHRRLGAGLSRKRHQCSRRYRCSKPHAFLPFFIGLAA